MSIRKALIGASLLLLTLSAVFGFLNKGKVKSLRTEHASALAARDVAENARAAQRQDMRGRETHIAAASAKFAKTEKRAANAEAALAKAEAEKASLESKLQTNENERTQLQKRIEELAPGSARSDTLPDASAVELQAQLEGTRKQPKSAEREKSVLSEKIRGGEERSPQGVKARTPRRSAISQLGVHGTVLAVNQAYNFVVLNLGGRHGVEANSEMLVARGSALIGKIRISSVEPATAIGDIIPTSVPRGVRVQPGDTLIYAGPNP